MKPEKHKLCEWEGSQCASRRGENFYVDVQHNAKKIRNWRQVKWKLGRGKAHLWGGIDVNCVCCDILGYFVDL